MSKFIPTKKSNPCPVCSDTSGKCRTQNDSPIILCGNLGNGDSPIGYRFVKPSTGIWNIFAPDDQAGNWQDRLDAKVGRDRLKAGQEAIEREALPSLESRHKLLCAKSNTLTRSQNSDLLRRGLTQSEIDGCLSRQWLWQEWGGYGIAAIDPATGLIVGGQLARDDRRDSKYSWLLPGQTHLQETGQNPLSVWVSPDFDRAKAHRLNLCDAFLKPLLAGLKAWRSDNQQVWIGRGGGKFQEAALVRVLEQFPGADLVYHPDGGDFMNPNMVSAIDGLRILAKSEKRVLTIAWWGQFSKSDPDCDELTGDESIRELTPDEYLRFCWKGTRGDLNNWRSAGQLTAHDTIDSKFFKYSHFNAGEIFAVKSGLGSGKTHYLGGALQAIYRESPKTRTVIFAPTNTLCDGLRGRLQQDWGLKSSHPKDIDFAELKQSDKGAIAICCPDSAALIPRWFLTGAILVVDEAVSCRSAFTQRIDSTRRDDAIELIRYGIQYCDRALFFDGNLTDDTVEWYQHGTGRSVHKIQNIHKTNTYTENLYLHKNRWTKSLESHPLKTSPIALAGDTLVIQDIVKSLLEENPGATGKVLCSKTAHEPWVPAAMENTTAFIEKTRPNIFAFSPSAESGVDISTENYFGAVYGLFTGVTGTDSQSQHLARVREKVDRHVYCNPVGISDQEASGATSYKAVKDSFDELLMAQARAVLNGTDRSELLEKFNRLWADTMAKPETEFEMRQIAIANIERENLLACHIMRSLDAGHTVNIVGGKIKTPAIAENISRNTVERKATIAAAVLAAPLVEESEIESLKQSRKPRTPEQDAMCDRFFLEKRLPGISDTDEWNDTATDPDTGTIENVEFVRELLESEIIGAAENWYSYQNLANAKRSDLENILMSLDTGKIELTKKSRYLRIKAIKDAGFDRVLELGEFTGKHPAVTQFLWNFRKSLPTHGLKLHAVAIPAIKQICKLLGLKTKDRRTQADRFYAIDKLSYSDPGWGKTVYQLIEKKRQLIAENYVAKDLEKSTTQTAEILTQKDSRHDTIGHMSLNRNVAVVSCLEVPVSSPPIALEEWDYFLNQHRLECRTHDSFRALTALHPCVPKDVWDQLWEAIKAA